MKNGVIIITSIILSLLMINSPIQAGSRGNPLSTGQYMDSKYNHNRLYPSKGQFVDELPQGHRPIFLGKERYEYCNGVWYRPMGRKYLVVAPPVGLNVPFLPPFHSTFWIKGAPYYYANEVYYTQSPVGYVVVKPPKGEISWVPPGKRLYIYPRQNQNQQIQDRDRLECQTWAEKQTNFTPANPPANMTEGQKAQGQEDFNKAMGACLEAKGYSVR
jgi:hypothetical protein